jgi:hypothetical protein
MKSTTYVEMIPEHRLDARDAFNAFPGQGARAACPGFLNAVSHRPGPVSRCVFSQDIDIIYVSGLSGCPGQNAGDPRS